MHKAIMFEPIGEKGKEKGRDKTGDKGKEKRNKTVRCTACANYCIIGEGRTGICGVRENIGGTLYLLVYGQAIAAHTDPMEKKPLYHFLPGKRIFSVGTIGCNFACEFCQNWDISQASKGMNKKNIEQAGAKGRYGRALSPEEIVSHCKRENIPAIAFTYNEPSIFFEYAYDTMRLAKKAGIKTVYVSNGYESEEALLKLKGSLDAINIDLKAFSEDFYKRICHARLAPVLKTIKRCHELGMWVELTTLIIPGENDSDEELGKIADFIASIDKDIPWHISAFHPDYKFLEKDSTPHETLMRAYEIGKKRLNHVYVGNVVDDERSATYCPKCHAALIERRGYAVEAKGLSGDKCKRCGAIIAGIF